MFDQNASDEELAPEMKKLLDLCAKIYKLGGCHFNLIISPSIIGHLSKIGFFKEDADIFHPNFVSGDYIHNLSQRIVTTISDLTEEQLSRISEIIKMCDAKMEEIRLERLNLNKDLNEAFLNHASTPGDKVAFLELISLVEFLRLNANEERRLQCS